MESREKNGRECARLWSMNVRRMRVEEKGWSEKRRLNAKFVQNHATTHAIIFMAISFYGSNSNQQSSKEKNMKTFVAHFINKYAYSFILLPPFMSQSCSFWITLYVFLSGCLFTFHSPFTLQLHFPFSATPDATINFSLPLSQSSNLLDLTRPKQ